MTGSLLTFVIPVRHQDNAADWGLLTQRLQQTIRSVSAQDTPGWRGVVVANEGADLPAMPPNWDVVRVGFPPNVLHERGSADKETFYDAFRLDKGRRVLSGMMAARDSAYFMIVDDDDFVSRRLTGYVGANKGQIGWQIAVGYLWEDGSRIVFLHDEFARICGTSHIIRNDIYELPESFADASEDYMKSMFGSHVELPAKLQQAGMPLPKLPFPGAVYRIGHAGAHSKSTGLMAQIFSKDRNLLQSTVRLSRIRLRTRSLRDEFFGGSVAAQPNGQLEQQSR
ncbi:galactosyl transferase [Devosia nitrariae]|uniref:Galactosyl transferase n=1 Tax=Devosia nitrariae TaxID=2071872 RepID=A0ABQ5VYN8_9HYPH|nr:galactosyl transferase [Devosia nitrariae]GLQ52755.1 galactosyl transferase [Devosia nitrariae]